MDPKLRYTPNYRYTPKYRCTKYQNKMNPKL